MSIARWMLAGACALALVGCAPKGKGNSKSAPKGITEKVDPGLKLSWSGDADAQLPMSLTASDGTGLKLVSLTVRAVVNGPLAFTELHLVFDNPEDRQREGRFEITLPPSAAISRFAMKIGERWQEAEVVERQAARVAYEDFMHRRQDPALLEKKAGNQFRARVFPIPAGARKELIVSYSEQILGADGVYRLRLSGLPDLEALDVKILALAQGGKKRVATAIATSRVATKDLELRVDGNDRIDGLRFETLAMGRVRPKLDLPPAVMEDLTIAFDTSGSRALGYDAQVGRLVALIAELRRRGGDFPLRVVAYDQSVSEIYRGRAADFGEPQRQMLIERMALGASDLARLLDWLAAHPGSSAHDSRIILYGDGVVTAGERDAGELAKLVGALSGRSYGRLDAVVDGGIRDEPMLEALVNAGLGSAGVLVDADSSRLVDRLLLQTRSGVEISVPGAQWSWPTSVDGLQGGDELLVFAHLPVGTPMRVVLAGVADSGRELSLRPAQRPLLERAWVRSDIARMTAKLAKLEKGDDGARQKLRARILEQSVGHRVLSDLTALLVLETEQDYRRFRIDRNALTDIMTVGEGGVELSGRAEPPRKPRFAEARRSLRRPTPPPRLRAARSRAKRSGLAPEGGAERAVALEQFVDSEAARATVSQLAASAGIIGTMGAAPAPSDARQVSGNEPTSALGALMEDQLRATVGFGGLAAVGTGRGGGGGSGPVGTTREVLADVLAGGAVVGSSSAMMARSGGIGTAGGYGRGAGGFRGRAARVPRIGAGRIQVRGSISRHVIHRTVRRHMNEVRFCYEQQLVSTPGLNGRLSVKFIIAPSGSVQMAAISGSTVSSAQLGECVVKAVRRWTFPAPDGGGIAVVTYPFTFTTDGQVLQPELRARRVRQRPGRRVTTRRRRPAPVAAIPSPKNQKREDPAAANAYSGTFAEVMSLLAQDRIGSALPLALAWHRESPGDVLALIAMGECFEHDQQLEFAARVYGTLIDLFPSRADLRRMAAERLDRLGRAGQSLALDSYRVAVEQRPDHPSSHRLYAYALLQSARFEDAFDALKVGLSRRYPGGRFRAVSTILAEDLGLIGAAWLAAQPDARAEIMKRLGGVPLATEPSTRFVLHWETDANDVDLHVYDRDSDHAFYSNQIMVSGGHLYADVTTGYGPECFAIEGKASAYPYTLQANYYRKGPMGYGMGKLHIIQHDGHGKLEMQHRPFVVMNDHSFVNLGTLDGPLPSPRGLRVAMKRPSDGYVPPVPRL